MVTTGRGGTGNFAVGLDADEKRRRQDVVPERNSVVRRDSHGATHIGRGGTGNVVRAGAEEAVIPGVAPAASAAPASPTEKEQKEKKEQNKEQSATAAAAAAPAAEQRKSEEIGWAEKGKNLLFGKK
ncbi:hypothetical protein N0V88_004103 [Collariella sp. IMI 366227]|nr:hypothetical protein N0V88_004103 [Collariella sp. IMI 366227]